MAEFDYSSHHGDDVLYVAYYYMLHGGHVSQDRFVLGFYINGYRTLKLICICMIHFHKFLLAH